MTRFATLCLPVMLFVVSSALGCESLTVDQAVSRFKTEDPTISKFFNNCQGYAIYPTVSKGGLGVGGAGGKGEVYEKGKLVGTSKLSQGSIGLQVGGQTYSEIIFFQNSSRLSEFKKGSFEFQAQASAVVAKAGAGANHDYSQGVAVFTMPIEGLMVEAAIGGQKFSYKPK